MRKSVSLILFLTSVVLLIYTSCFPLLCIAAAGRSCLNRVKSIAYTRGSNSEKITIFLDREVSYKARFLDENQQKKIPFRLYIDLLNTCLEGKPENIHPESSSIKRIRAAQRNRKTTRVVLDLKKRIYRNDYKISQHKESSSVVIELFSNKSSMLPAKKSVQPVVIPSSKPPVQKQKKSRDKKKPVPEKEVLQDLPKGSDMLVIVVDPGHGGKDPGATGYRGNREKDVCLSIALEMKKMLDEKLNAEIILTRNTDTFISLEKRAEIANSRKADLFISIHANSHEDTALNGIETYYLNFSSDATARKVAARENFTTPSEISDLEMILFDLMQSSKINKSSIFAGYIHNALVENILTKYKSLRNLGVKHAPMRVLIEAEMPGVLIETAFISNPSDLKRLKSRTYHKLIARAVLDGIRGFIKEQKKLSMQIQNEK